MRCIGYDISDEGVKIAKRASEGMLINYTVRSIEGIIDEKDNSVDIVLDMMTSHFLKAKEREHLRNEVLRVLKPGGWYFFKSFLADQDMHVKRLLKEHPADEPDAYIHPELGVYEHVWTEQSLHDFFAASFDIQKIERSHKHIKDGKAFKRRTVTAYLRKPF